MTDLGKPLVADYAITSTAQVYRYGFENFGWARFFICDDTGTFFIESDWGDFSFSWPRHHRTQDLKAFLVTCGGDYVLRKFQINRPAALEDEFDEEGTRASFKEEIRNDRRDGRLTRQKARELYDEVDGLDFGTGSDLCIQNMRDSMSDDLEIVLGGEWYEFICRRRSHTFRFVRDRLFPFFQDRLREELGLPEAKRA